MRKCVHHGFALCRILVVGGFLLLGQSLLHAATRPPNILFILADDLGYGDLGCYGQKQILTPNLDRMAAEGIRFTQVYAGSTVCAPSRCVLMTGLHTGHCWIRGNSGIVRDQSGRLRRARISLRPEDRTVAEWLKRAGYVTGLIGKWGLGEPGTTGIPTRQGFDEFFGYLNQHHAHNYYPSYLWWNETKIRLRNVVPNEDAQGGGVATVRLDYSHDLFIEQALRFIERHHKRPFFLYLALTIPHANNEAGSHGMEVPDLGPYADRPWPEPEKGRAAMITRMDRDIGRILQLLRKLGIERQTIVFFSSDNGPHKEGGTNPEFFDSNGPLRGIKRDLYEGGIRVPMIVWWPGTIRPGQVSDFVWWFADFFPTASELAGLEPPPGLDGLSIVPLLRGHPDQQPPHKYLIWEFYERQGARAVRFGDWKAVIRPWNGPVELYNLRTDPCETHNVASRHPDLVQAALRILEESHRPNPHWPPPVPKSKSTSRTSSNSGKGSSQDRS